MYELEEITPPPRCSLTFPRIAQLHCVFQNDIAWENFRPVKGFEPGANPLQAEILLSYITRLHDAAVLLIYGKVAHSNTSMIFGVFTPQPSRDGTGIQQQEEGIEDWSPCSLFELSPLHDVSWGNIGQSAWEVLGGKLCFGQKDNGAAMVLENHLASAILSRCVDQENPVYSASTWRGDEYVRVEVDSIELWSDMLQRIDS